MKQKYLLILLGLLFASALIVGCGGGSGSGGSGGNGGSGNPTDGNWLVGTWEGTIPSAPEGDPGDLAGETISISIPANPQKVKIKGFDVFSYSGTITFKGIGATYDFGWNPNSYPDMNNSLIWGAGQSVTLLYMTEDLTVINLDSTSITPTSITCNWQIDLPALEITEGNSGIPNYHIVLNKL